jgi:transcriptional regulator with XRE-family HTH domain
MVASRTQVNRSLVGKTLRTLRLKRKMTQAELAERCSSRSSLVAYEAGQSEPKVTVLLDILRALDTDLHEFARAYYDHADRRRQAPEARSSGPALRELALRGRRVELEPTGTGLAKSSESAPRTFFVVDLGEEAESAKTEPVMIQQLLDRLTTLAYSQGAAKSEQERRRREQDERRDAADENPLPVPSEGKR